MDTSIEANAPAAPPPKSRGGLKPAIRMQFEIPIPPSTNALWFNLPGGKGRARTKAYCSWLTAVGWELKAQHVCPIPGRFVYLAVCAGLTKRERDLDNILKAIGDLLQAHGIIENDRAIVQIRALWDRTIPNDRIRVEVRQTRGPLQRMMVEGRARLSAERRGVPLHTTKLGVPLLTKRRIREKWQQALQCRRMGYTIRQIAEAMEIATSTAFRYVSAAIADIPQAVAHHMTEEASHA